MKHNTAHPVLSYRDAAASKASQPMTDTATITKDTRLDSLRDLTVGDFLVIIARMLSADCRVDSHWRPAVRSPVQYGPGRLVSPSGTDMKLVNGPGSGVNARRPAPSA